MNTSLSLLELNVFSHCICTFAVYAIWWNKPMDISEPTLITVEENPELQGLIALLCSYTSLTVPRLPPPLADFVLYGHDYMLQSNETSHAGDDVISLNSQYSRRLNSPSLLSDDQPPEDRHQSRHYSPPEQHDHQNAESLRNSSSSFNTMSSSYMDSRTAGDSISLHSQRSRRTQSSYLSYDGRDRQIATSQYHGRRIQHTWRDDYSKSEYLSNLDTLFDTRGTPTHGLDRRYIRHCEPSVAENENQICEYAGLHINQLAQLFHLDETGPRM
jgi:hypothetical protein